MSGGPAPSVLLPNYQYLPAWWATRRKLRRLPTPDKLPGPPVGIVLHSGEKGPGTAEWAWKTDKTTGLGAAWFWAQFAWWHKKGCFVQTDFLDAWAPHGGFYNQFSIGLELPGPFYLDPRPEEHRLATVKLVTDLVTFCPTICWLTGHMFFDKAKQDPGPGVKPEWFDGLGLDVKWEWVGRSLLPE